jgi:hypothetical protein
MKTMTEMKRDPYRYAYEIFVIVLIIAAIIVLMWFINKTVY